VSSRLFSFLPNVDRELVNVRATVTGPRPAIAPLTLPDGDGDPAGAVVDTHAIHVLGRWMDTRVYDRAGLRAGDVVTGPAIVVEMDATTLVLPGNSEVSSTSPTRAVSRRGRRRAERWRAGVVCTTSGDPAAPPVDAEVDADATEALRARMRADRPDPLPVFDKGPAIAELLARCESETGLPAPKPPPVR